MVSDSLLEVETPAVDKVGPCTLGGMQGSGAGNGQPADCRHPLECSVLPRLIRLIRED